MRYYLEVLTLKSVILHAIEKKDLVKFFNEHPKAFNIDKGEYERLKSTQMKNIETLWEACQIVHKGIAYNLATSDFYEYVRIVLKDVTNTSPDKSE